MGEFVSGVAIGFLLGVVLVAAVVSDWVPERDVVRHGCGKFIADGRGAPRFFWNDEVPSKKDGCTNSVTVTPEEIDDAINGR